MKTITQTLISTYLADPEKNNLTIIFMLEYNGPQSTVCLIAVIALFCLRDRTFGLLAPQHCSLLSRKIKFRCERSDIVCYDMTCVRPMTNSYRPNRQ